MQNLCKKTYKHFLIWIPISLIPLYLSCGSAPIQTQPVKAADAVCILEELECVFDQGDKKNLLKKGRPRMASPVQELKGWVAMPPSIYQDLIRKFPETSK